MLRKKFLVLPQITGMNLHIEMNTLCGKGNHSKII